MPFPDAHEKENREGERKSVESWRRQEIVRAAITVWEIQTMLKKSRDRESSSSQHDGQNVGSVAAYENTKKI